MIQARTRTLLINRNRTIQELAEEGIQVCGGRSRVGKGGVQEATKEALGDEAVTLN